MSWELYIKPRFGWRLRWISAADAQAKLTAGAIRRVGAFLFKNTAPAPIPPGNVGVTIGQLPVADGATVVIDFATHHADLASAGTVTIVINVGAGDKTFTAAVAAGDGVAAIARKTAQAAGWATNGLSAANQGGNVTVTNNSGSPLTKLTVTIA